MGTTNVSIKKAAWWAGQEESFKVDYRNSFYRNTRETANGCIETTFSIDAQGYGSYPMGKWYQSRAHMVAWIMEYGGYHPFLELDHICANRACVNTKHLRLVTKPEHNVITSKARRDNPEDTRFRRCIDRDAEYSEVVEHVEEAQEHRRTCGGYDAEMDRAMERYMLVICNQRKEHNRLVERNLRAAIRCRSANDLRKQEERDSIKAVDEEMAFYTTVLNPPSKGAIMLTSNDLINEAIREMSDLGIIDDEYESIVEDLLVLLPKRRWRALAHKLLAVTNDLLDDMIDIETAEEEIYDIIEEAHFRAIY